MAYTRAWDETFPPDTQAANLLGQDIRQFKQDIRERLGTYLSGTAAARPTPEAGWAGLIYIATDTGVISRWNGATWATIPITATGSGATTQTDYSGVRGSGVIYQNTDAVPRFVNIVVSIPATINNFVVSDAANPPTKVVSWFSAPAGGSMFATLSFVVLPNHYYKLDQSGGGSCTKWFEWK